MHLKRDRFYGLLGPNQCGKTTLMRAIANALGLRLLSCCRPVSAPIFRDLGGFLDVFGSIWWCFRGARPPKTSRHAGICLEEQLEGFPKRDELKSVFVEHEIEDEEAPRQRMRLSSEPFSRRFASFSRRFRAPEASERLKS